MTDSKSDYKSLDHAMEILSKCVHPYTGEQAQAVAKVLAQWQAKWAAAVDLIGWARKVADDLNADRLAEIRKDLQRRLDVWQKEQPAPHRSADAAAVRAGFSALRNALDSICFPGSDLSRSFIRNQINKLDKMIGEL